MSMKYFWEQHSILKRHKIPLKTFYWYARNDDKSKRRRIGGQAGRPSQNTAKYHPAVTTAVNNSKKKVSSIESVNVVLEKTASSNLDKAKAKQDCVILGNHYQWLIDIGKISEPASQERVYQKEGEAQSRLERQYLRMQCNFGPGERTVVQKKTERDWWRINLPRYCAMIGGGEEFLREELIWLSKCSQTFGSSEVIYEGPSLNEDGEAGGKRSQKRWRRMSALIKLFRQVQTRHALSMLNSTISCSKLLVALDFMLEKYDDGLMAKGMQPSDLRWRLRETNYQNQPENLGTGADISDLGVSDATCNMYCRQIRDELTASEGGMSTHDVESRKDVEYHHNLVSEASAKGQLNKMC